MQRWAPKSPEETRAVARRLAERWTQPRTVGLVGPLGAGKTTFVRGIVQARGGDPGAVRSPTFTLMHRLEEARPTVIHADLYRVSGAEAQRTIGLEESFGRALVLVEWADRWERGWPSGTDTLHFRHGPDGGRIIQWIPDKNPTEVSLDGA